MELLKYTFYINLESRKDRLKEVQEELTKIGVVGERFNAIHTKSGSIGCFLSHIKCVELAKERGYEQVFICEDDIQFLDPALFMENLTKFYENDEIMWDMLMVAGNVVKHIPVTDYCSRVLDVQTTTGYVVKSIFYDTLLMNYKKGLQLLMREPAKANLYAIDIFWKSLQPSYYWYIITPLTVTQRAGFSDIECRVTDYGRLMLDINKEWLRRPG